MACSGGNGTVGRNGRSRKALDRGMEYYRRKGYTDAWIKERLQSKSIRDDLTAEWKRSGIESSREFAALTNILTKSWSGKTVQEYKRHKNLHNENLRDNMTNLELTLNQLAEVSATAISKVKIQTAWKRAKSSYRWRYHCPKCPSGPGAAARAECNLSPKCLRSSRLGNRSDEF